VAIRLQVLAVVLSDGRGDGDGLLGSGGDTSGDTPASAGGGVLGVGVARRSIGGNSGGNLGSLAGSNGTVGTLELGGGISVNGNGDGGGGRLRDDGGGLEAGAVGLAGLNGGQAGAGAGDLTSTVVTTAAGTLLEVDSAGHDGGSERKDGSDLHFGGCWVVEGWKRRS